VKDNSDVAGLQTTGGSSTRRVGAAAGRDRRAQAARRRGFVLARTSLSEWARGGIDTVNSVLPPASRVRRRIRVPLGTAAGHTVRS
jgi:Asp-tRNA(Asn)/Glu-tRNA(Gln) amidotransferase A subunit family amidase